MLNLIGRTPLVPLNGISDEVGRTILVKIESRSLGGSIKDRPALFMIDDARKRGLLQPDARIVEATSGNMGIGLAQIAVIRHHPITIVMPEGMSQERISHLRALGAIVELTPSAEGMQGAIARAEAIIKKEPGAFIPRQFENPANVEAHYRTTGPEILADLGSVPDGFVSGVGTGGRLQEQAASFGKRTRICKSGRSNRRLQRCCLGKLRGLTGSRESGRGLSQRYLTWESSTG